MTIRILPFFIELYRRGFTCRCWLLLSALVLAGCASLNSDKRLVAQVDDLLAPLVVAKEFSGAVVLTRQGKIVYSRGVGMANHEAGTHFTPDTPSDGASLAKTFTAAGLWWLAQEGRVDLNAPVVRYVHEFPHAQTTVRQLISHGDGLPNYEFFDAHFGKDEVRTTQAMLGVIAQHAPTPSFPPGSRFEYTNFGFDVAALVIESVSGQSFDTFLQQRFFSRLRMNASFTRPARLSDWKGVRTLGYRWQNDQWTLFDVYDMEGFIGASNVYFSATDLSRWASANAASVAVPSDVFAAGQQPILIGALPSPITGLSWYCDESGARCYYTGDLNAFHSFVYWDRLRNESAVFVSNSNLPPWSLITLQRQLVSALAERGGEEILATPFEPFNESSRSAIAGIYVAEGIGTITLNSADNHLRLRVDQGLEFDVYPVTPEVFYVPGTDYWLAFSGGRSPSKMHIKTLFVDTVAHRHKMPLKAVMPNIGDLLLKKDQGGSND